MRRLPLALLLVSLACAHPAAPAASPDLPRVVVVLAAWEAATPPPSGVATQLLQEAPARLLAREVTRGLEGRGYRVLAAEVASGAETDARAVALARAEGAEAAWVFRLANLDLSTMALLGRAKVELGATLLFANGDRRWQRTVRSTTAVKTYRASADWRAHLREGLRRTMEELP